MLGKDEKAEAILEKVGRIAGELQHFTEESIEDIQAAGQRV